MHNVKKIIKSIPILGTVSVYIYRNYIKPIPKFENSGEYWEKRYELGLTSGDGSYNNLAKFKATIINEFVSKHGISNVVEWGCGDGNQLKLSNYGRYHGFDVSSKAISICREMFEGDLSKKFALVSEYKNEKYDLSISLDVIYHLVEDDVFEQYMYQLFSSSSRYVIIYSSNTENLNDNMKHVKHRKFTDWIDKYLGKEWTLIDVVENIYPYNGNPSKTSFSNFYIYEKLK